MSEFRVKGKAAPLLELEAVSVFRGDVPALRNFSWLVWPGQHWAILGPNGSGKSTLVQTLQGWLWPREGEIRVMGRRFGDDDLSELRRRVAWVGTDAEGELPPHQTVADIVASGAVGTMGLQFDAPSGAQWKSAQEAIRFLGLERLWSRPFRALSQGQRRLTVIARALAMKPDLLLLDEPAAGLDPVAREKFLGKVSRLLRPESRPLVIYVTHHLEEILPGFTHVLGLRRGRVAAQGARGKALTAPVLRKVFGAPLEIEMRGSRAWMKPVLD